MTPEQERALALARARRRRADAEGVQTRPSELGIANEAIVRTLGFPVDAASGLINAGISGFNTVTGQEVGHIEAPIGGSDSLRNVLQGAGDATARAFDDETASEDMFAGREYQPEGVGENLIFGAASAGAGIGPLALGGRAAQAGGQLMQQSGNAFVRGAGGVVDEAGKFVAQPFATAPLRTSATEVAAGAGAAVGAETAEQLDPDNPVAPLLGAMVGGGVAGLGPYAVGQTAKSLPGVRAATGFVKSEIAPFTEAGAMQRARNRMANVAEDPQAAIAGLRSSTISEMSPAQSTGDRRLMALEQRVRDTDPAVDMRMREQEAQGRSNLRNALVEPARPAGAETFDLTNPVSAQAEGEVMSVEIMRGADGRPEALYTDQGIVQVPEAYRDLSPEDIIVRQLGYDDGTSIVAARMGESGAPLDGAPARQFVEGAIDREVGGVSQALDDTFGAPVPNATAVGNLQRSTQPARSAAYDQAYNAEVNLYATESGRQLETLLARVQGAAPGALRRANQLMAGSGDESNQMLLQEAADGSVTLSSLPDTRQWDFITRALRDMAGSTEGNGAFGGQNTYGSTLSALSREIRGNVRNANPAYGNALDTAATALGQRDALRFGADMLNPSIPRDVVAAELADMTPAEQNFVRQAVRAQLDEQLANVRSTISNPDTGLREAQSALQRMSSRAVRDKISALFPAEQARGLFQRMDEATATLDPRRSGLPVFAGARPGEEMQAVFRSPNPAQAARQLVAAAASDTTGQALPSLKGSFIDEIMNRSRSGSFDDGGEPVLSGRAMRNTLGDRRVAPVADVLLSQEERGRLNQVVEELTRAEVANGRLPDVGDVMEGEPNSMISFVARTIAARYGAHAGRGAGGASLLTANFASQRMKQLLERLTLDRAEGLIRQAITGDRELFEALLTPAERWTSKQESRLFDVLSATAQGATTGTMVRYPSTEEQESSGDPLIDLVMRGNAPEPEAQVATYSEFDEYLQNMMAQHRPRQQGPDYSQLEEILAAMM